MVNETYYFEIKDLLVQFVHAFDDIVISRFNKDREVKDKISVRYVYAPKQRAIHDIVNKAQHFRLPVVAIWITSVQRDNNRVINKGNPYYSKINNENTKHLWQPVPVNININLSILTKYQSDIDQIISNWVPYSDPYIIVSWKRHDFPEEEMRTEINWDGNINLDYPIDVNNTDPTRITADTSFLVKGWLFRKDEDTPIGNIFKIDSNFTATPQFEDLDDLRNEFNTDFRTLSARAQITYINSPYTTVDVENDFDLFGKFFTETSQIYLSGSPGVYSNQTLLNPFSGLDLSATYTPFEGKKIETFTIESENLISFTLPAPETTGYIDLIVVNQAGYGKLTTDSFNELTTFQYPFVSGIEILNT